MTTGGTGSPDRLVAALRRRRTGALAMALLVAACGSDSSRAPLTGAAPDPGGTNQSPSNGVGDDLATTPTGPTTEPTTGQTTTVPRPVGPPLAAGSTVEEILDAVEDAHGPTTDASAQVNRFGTFPSLATPPGAELVELRADARATGDGAFLVITSQLVLEVAAAPDDLTVFYGDELDRLGWPRIDERKPIGPPASHILIFDQPDGANPLADLTITIGESATERDDAASRVRIDHVAWVPAADTTVRERLSSWADGLPLPEGGQVTGAGLQTSSRVRPSLHLTLTVAYTDLSPAEAATALRRALPAGGFSERPVPPTGDSLDNWVFIDSERFSELRVSPHLAPGAVTQLAVNARMAFGRT